MDRNFEETQRKKHLCNKKSDSIFLPQVSNTKKSKSYGRDFLKEMGVCNKKIHCEKNMDNQMIAIKNAFICNNFYKNFFIEKKEGRAGVFDEEQIVPNDGNVVFEEKDPLDKYFAF